MASRVKQGVWVDRQSPQRPSVDVSTPCSAVGRSNRSFARRSLRRRGADLLHDRLDLPVSKGFTYIGRRQLTIRLRNRIATNPFVIRIDATQLGVVVESGWTI